MSSGYRWATGAVVGLFVFVALASYYGWGLPSDAQALAQRQSVRGGSLHSRHHFGGGPGWGQ